MAVAGQQQVLATPFTTKEALTFPVDYNAPSAIDPPSWVRFCTQAQITQFLTAKGATAFKHLQAVWDSVPEEILHNVTINLAAGVHRPQPVPTYGPANFAWFFLGKRIDQRAQVTITGPAPSTWTAVDPSLASLTVTAYQAGSGDPYLDFSGTPFLGFSLKGRYVVLSTGQVLVIHDHTNSRLYVCSNLSPNPVGGTAKVARPSAIMRNSLDDINAVTFYDFGVGATHRETFSTWNSFLINNLRFQCLKSNMALSIINGLTSFTQCEVDAETYDADASGAWAYESSYAYFTACSFVATLVKPDNALTILSDCMIGFYNSYCKGWSDGIGISFGSYFDGYESVFEMAGPFRLEGGSVLFDYYGTGKIPELRGNGIYFQNDSYNLTFGDLSVAPWTLIMKNMTQSCLRFGTNNNIDLSGSTISGSGNAAYGVELIGESSSVRLGPNVTVSGTAGEVKMADQDIWSYADIVSLGPIVDGRGNVVRKDS